MGHKKRSKGVLEFKRLEIRLESEKRRLERKIKAFGAESEEALKQIERVKRARQQLRELA